MLKHFEVPVYMIDFWRNVNMNVERKDVKHRPSMMAMCLSSTSERDMRIVLSSEQQSLH